MIKWLLILGGVGVMYLIMRDKKKLGEVVQGAEAAAFRLIAPEPAKFLVDPILAAAAKHKVSPFILLAIAKWESNYGRALDAHGKGDKGHGHGIFQIDDRTWGEWLAKNNWRDPFVNADKGAEILAIGYTYFRNKGLEGEALARAAVAAYNAGPGNVWKAIQAGQDPDSRTTGKNYGSKIIAEAQSLYAKFEQALKA